MVGELRTPQEKVATLLHEITHTQEESEFVGHFKNYYYGNDNSHSRFELLANFNAAFKEGIANAYAFAYLGNTPIQAWNLFNQRVIYEIVPKSICNTIFNDCIDIYMKNIGKAGKCNTANCTYNINDLPAPLLLHNEYVQATIFFGFTQKFGIEALSSLLISNRQTIKGTYGFPILFDAMMDWARIAQIINPKDKLPKEYYPIALMDYSTNWGLKELSSYQETLRRLHCKISDLKIDTYWSEWRIKYINAINQSYASGIPLF